MWVTSVISFFLRETLYDSSCTLYFSIPTSKYCSRFGYQSPITSSFFWQWSQKPVERQFVLCQHTVSNTTGFQLHPRRRKLSPDTNELYVFWAELPNSTNSPGLFAGLSAAANSGVTLALVPLLSSRRCAREISHCSRYFKKTKAIVRQLVMLLRLSFVFVARGFLRARCIFM